MTQLPRTWAALLAGVLMSAAPAIHAADAQNYDFDMEAREAGQVLGRMHTIKKAGENFEIQFDKNILVGCYPNAAGNSAVLLTCVVKTKVEGAKEPQVELFTVNAPFGKKINTKVGESHPNLTLHVLATKAPPGPSTK